MIMIDEEKMRNDIRFLIRTVRWLERGYTLGDPSFENGKGKEIFEDIVEKFERSLK